MTDWRIVTVNAGPVGGDFALPADVPLQIGLGAAGFNVDGLDVLALDRHGRRLDLTARVDQVLEDGELVALAAASRPSAGRSKTRPGPLRHRALSGPKSHDLPSRRDQANAGAPLGRVGASTVVGALALVGPLVAFAAAWPTLGTGAGAWASRTLALCLIASAVTTGALLTATLGPRAWRGALWPPALVLAALAVALAVAAAAGWPAQVVAGLVGFVPGVLRAGPSWVVRVPVEQLVDIAGNATNRWTVRGVLPGAPRPIRTEAVAALMAASVTRLRSSFTALSLASVVLVPVLLGHAGAQALTRWSGLAAGLSVALGLALVPRGAADFYARVAPRLASAAVTVELAVWWVRTADGSASLVVDLGLVGGAALFASVLAAGGYRSIGLSRLGDALQLLAVLVGPVAALVGSGLLELLRGAVS